MPDSEAKKKWMKENSKLIPIKFMKRTESDILEYLEDKPTATVIKNALRYYMTHEEEVNKYIESIRRS